MCTYVCIKVCVCVAVAVVVHVCERMRGYVYLGSVRVCV